LDEEKEEVVIIDFKSSQVDDQKSADKRAKESLQLDIYALAYQKIQGKIPDRLELHFLESGLIGVTEKRDKDLDKTIEEIRKVAKGIRARDYIPTPGYMVCQYCAYNQICPSTAFKSE
jgi:DNA helicase-2/ATP-dependent DNA helicase PcrA